MSFCLLEIGIQKWFTNYLWFTNTLTRSNLEVRTRKELSMRFLTFLFQLLFHMILKLKIAYIKMSRRFVFYVHMCR